MENYTPRLLIKYNSEAKSSLKNKLSIQNVMRLPKLTKIVLNMGLGNAKEDKNSLKQALEELTTISGQKAIGTKSKKAISNFKIRQGDPVGVSVTLRKTMMYEFLDRFISVAAPRIRDFRGFPSKGFDGRGNYNFGVTEQIIFPEINYDKVNSIRGINVTIVTTAHNDYESYELLVSLGFPINEYEKKTIQSKESKLTKDKIDEVEDVIESIDEEEIKEDSLEIENVRIEEDESNSDDNSINDAGIDNEENDTNQEKDNK